jgi:3-methyladenine DNA glycosylase AlkD
MMAEASAAAIEAGRISAQLRALAPEQVDPSPIIRTERPFYGVRLGDMDRIARRWLHAHPEGGAGEVLALADALWSRAVREEMVTASMLVGRHGPAREAFGMRRIDRWGRLLDSWETTDNLGGRVVGPRIAADPLRRFSELERLARRRNPWLRRLALVGCVTLGRRDDAARWWPQVAEIVLALVEDEQASIPRAISWVLRQHLRHTGDEVAGFVEEHADILPAVAVRETRNKLRTGTKSGRPPRPQRPTR